MLSLTNRAVLAGSLALATLVGLAPTANAGDDCRWELKIKRKAILSDNFEVELWAHIPDDAQAFASARLDLLTSGVDWVDAGSPCLLGISGGVIDGDDVRFIEVGQIQFPPAAIFADTANPIRVWCGEFEAQGGFPYRSVLTSTDAFRYYVDGVSSETEECSPIEAFRSVFVGPIVIGDWIAATFEDTIGIPRGDGLLLEAEGTAVPEIGAALTDETAAWSPGSRFEHTINVNRMPVAATFELDWFPWWQTPGRLREGLSASMTKTAIPGGPPVIEVTPDFGDVGVRRVPSRLILDGTRVGDPILGAGAAITLFNPCFELTWCYVLNTNDQLVLVLKCEDPFDIEIGGRRYTVDTIELDPQQAPGAVGGMDRAEVRATGTSTIEITGAGFTGSCVADCDGSGELNIFDFLCFQNRFATGDPAADIDGDGSLTIFDFLAFQNAFAAG
ncbi:MAG: hypothetical protein HRU13_12715, partial [Phycisphaerales bacterium]|nr:hypothetical protein [Phycisphaerales bacterium]